MLVIGCIALATLQLWILSRARHYADEAAARFPGDRVQALTALVDCEDCPLAERNHAAWALGQMEAEPALPVLKAHYDGLECTHEARLCQHELKKAIRQIERRRERDRLSSRIFGRW
jgi:hypothetical protein